MSNLYLGAAILFAQAGQGQESDAYKFGQAIGYVIVAVLGVLLLWKLLGGGKKKK